MSKAKVTILRRIPSKLIYIALADLAKAEKSKKYDIDMDFDWHGLLGDICIVCLAGSVMAFSLGADQTKDLTPLDMKANYWQLMALNSLRNGNVIEACHQLGLPQRVDLNTDITPYRTSPTAFRCDMEALAAKLEREGL